MPILAHAVLRVAKKIDVRYTSVSYNEDHEPVEGTEAYDVMLELSEYILAAYHEKESSLPRTAENMDADDERVADAFERAAMEKPSTARRDASERATAVDDDAAPEPRAAR